MCRVIEVSLTAPGDESETHSPADGRLAERRLVEAAQLARMQGRALLAQDVDGRQADLQVLADRALVEGVRLAGQLDLAVQRLVRDAEQRSVRHPEAVALGGD